MPIYSDYQSEVLRVHGRRLFKIPEWGTACPEGANHPWDCSMYIIRMVRELCNNQNIAKSEYRTINAADIVRYWTTKSGPGKGSFAFPVVGLIDNEDTGGRWQNITHIAILIDQEPSDIREWLVLDHHVSGLGVNRRPGVYELRDWFNLTDPNFLPRYQTLVDSTVIPASPRYCLYGPMWLSCAQVLRHTEYISPGANQEREQLY